MAKIKERGKKSWPVRLAVLCLAGYAATVFFDHRAQIDRGRERLALLEQSCEAQRIANKEVERMLQLGDDEGYIERVARAKSGYAYPDERIFYSTNG